MKLKVDESHKFLVLEDSTMLEYEQIESSFTKRTMNWAAIRSRNNQPKTFETKFIDHYSRIPIGLWNEVQKLAKKYFFNIDIKGLEYIYDKDFDESDFVEWVNTYFEESEKQPRDYQIEGVIRAIKYKNCIEEISTSGGKTLMAFMLFKYLFDKKIIKKMLYVVPNIGLINQTEEEFYEIEENCGKKPNWKSNCVFGGKGTHDDKEPNIVFGTFQSLTKKDLEYFSTFDAVFIDESHHAKTYSIKSILIKSHNSKYNIGMTGTVPPEGTLDSFTIQSYLGPCVYIVQSADLIDAKFATPVKVVGIEMNYLAEDLKKKLYDLRNVSADEKDGVKLLNLEKDIIRENRKRLVYICEKIAQTTKNSLVLFSDIKNDYGKKVYNYIKENTNKIVYYIDGGTKAENRDYFKKQMEDEENVIIVASIGVFSEGISIHNLHNIFIIESAKSEYIIRQILGRGMRLMEGKETITVIDFSDNFEYGTNKYQKINYLLRHSKERERIYKDKGFPFKRFKVTL
ncbi:DEAD/DEAH box helicase family protein [bacterium]|jgi:superfamily II DNA or RNA helicase|nr:DEAD/DEAH box helicase family protein [bacterium]